MKKLIIITLLLLQSNLAFGMQTGITYGVSLGEKVASLANWSISWKNEDDRANLITLKTASDMNNTNRIVSVFTETDQTFGISIPLVYAGTNIPAGSAKGEWTMLARFGLANTTIEGESQQDILIGWSFLAFRDYAVVFDTCTFTYYISLNGQNHFDFDMANFGFFF